MDAAIIGRIAIETAIPETSVSAAIALLENGATGPFIAHYRKEAVGGLDEAKIRTIQDRMAHYREVLELRAALIKTLTEQEKLTEELQAKIGECYSRAELDDMQHRWRPRKKTRALEALDKGLEPLAGYFWRQESDGRSVDEHLDVFVDPAKGVVNREQALQGAVDIMAEWIWENAAYRQTLREMLWSAGQLVSSVVPAKAGQKTKYTMYYDRREPVTSIPSHRVLAIRRGCKEGILSSSIEGDNDKAIEFLISAILKNPQERDSEFFPVLETAIRESYTRLLRPMIETEVRTQLKERADREAIKVFQENLSSLLLSPPAGPIVVMGADMAKGKECSLAVVDATGRFLEGAKIRLTEKTMAEKANVPEASEAIVPEAREIEAREIDARTPDVEVAASAAPIDVDVDAREGDQSEAEAAAPVETPTDSVASAAVTETTEEVEAAATTAAVVESAAVSATDEPVAAVIVDPLTQLLQGLAAPLPASGKTPAAPEKLLDPRKVLRDLLTRHKVQAVAIGAGTTARELETMLRQVLADAGLTGVFIAAVNDAGLAIYSSSRQAREEFPSSSASARCAVSLARRLQDPLAELVKIDPKLIGVGQYQHDVDQKELHRGLSQTVQFCVNNVGVNLNSAGAPLLRYVSGLNDKTARHIVAVRAADGAYPSREALKTRAGLDDAVYTQCAAFLRISEGENALDRTAVHPEHYALVEKMAAAAGVSVSELVGNEERVAAINLQDYTTDTVGLPTLGDIREELLRPGRDPRRLFRLPRFNPEVREMSDLKPGMALEGIVTNVTNFGAFVDIGVRQDGLVHLSQMSSRFIRDPREAVKVGDVVEVRVISVEPETKRIGLSMKTAAPAGTRRRPRPPRHDAKPAPRGDGQGNNRPARRSAEGATDREGADRNGQTGPGGQRRDRSEGRKANDKARRNRNRPPRKTGEHSEMLPSVPPPTPESEGPELSMEDKIAMLQSKFQGIK